MSLIDGIVKITVGAAAGVALATTLPFWGPVGTLTATGAGVSACVGGFAGLIDSFKEKHK